MKIRLHLAALLLAVSSGLARAAEQTPVTATPPAHELTVAGTRFLLDGKPFPYTGLSFFNAIYNPEFNRSPEDRARWLEKFQKYGINVLRLWAQWNNKHGFVDTAPEHSLYLPDGRLRESPLATLRQILIDADRAGMVVELALFSQESWKDGLRLTPEATDQAVAALTRALQPHRNLTFQIWNEFFQRTPEIVKIIKAIDPRRLVTSAHGFPGTLGEAAQNHPLDYLTPHTSRQGSGRPWHIAPQEISYLLARYRKPVVDDEPARNGTANFGGPKAPTSPYDHILQIYQVWQAGGYINYHHDMFQLGYGAPTVPPSGIPDPEFNPYHKQVLEFIALRDRYMVRETR